MTSQAAAWRTRNSLLCVGLDPDPDTDRRKRLWTVSSSSTSSGVHLREPLAREEYGPHGATFDGLRFISTITWNAWGRWSAAPWYWAAESRPT